MSLGERYGLLIGACSFTSLPGFLGFLFPKKFTKKYMGVFLSVGIGCLLATIFLHILPEVMEEAGKHEAAACGSQSHGHNHGHNHGHKHSHGDPHSHTHQQPQAGGANGGSHDCNHELMKAMGAAALIGILFAFIMENFLHNHDHGPEDGHGHGHTHSHGCGRHSISCHAHEAKEEIRLSVRGKIVEMSQKPNKGQDQQKAHDTASNEDAHKAEHNHQHVHDLGKDDHSHEHEHDGSAETTTSSGDWSSAVISMIAAQMTHHACDGILLGSMFVPSDNNTIGKLCLTTLAFFAHEFGQSISGYAVYINAGWTTLASVGIVFMGYAPMFITATVMFFLATADASVKKFFERYCNPLGIGFFLYIVLADMVPDVIHYHSDTKWYNALAVVLSLVITGVMIWFIPHSH